jgi:hypothetical protein
MPATIMTNPLSCLSSGHWTGFSHHGLPESRTRVDLLLQLHENHLSGIGDDDDGLFVLRGEYDPREQEFRWVQTYLSGEAIFCRGFCDANRIWGTWQDAAEGHGGFQIWPLTGREKAEKPRPALVPVRSR